jgi:type VI secretion system protein ImpA
MASTETLDFSRILEPFPGENPAGKPLREDFSPNSLYYKIKDARASARAAERSLAYDDGKEESQQFNVADWKPVLELGPTILAEESKDLEIATWLTEALLRQHGYAGLRDGFRLLRELVERFWDNLYPLPDEDGLHGRIAPVGGLNGEGNDGVLIRPIFNVPITVAGTTRPLSCSDHQQATDLNALSDPEKRAQRIDQGAVTMQIFEQAVRETPSETLLDHLNDITDCLKEFESLCAALDGKCGNDDTGHSLAPPSSNIRNALDSCRDLLQGITRNRMPESGAAGETAGEASAAEAGGGIPAPTKTGYIKSRETAFQSLLQVAEFFKRTEPHSPISYALEQAVRWGRMPLPDLLTELIPEEPARMQLFKLVGITPPEKHT